MPFSLLLSVAAWALYGAAAPQQERVDDKLVVQWYRRTATADPPAVVFEHALATYGPTELVCDKLTVDLTPGSKHLVAEGHVHVLDIDGTLDADEVSVDWDQRTGTAQNVEAQIEGFAAHARSALIGPNSYELDNVYLTPCASESVPLLAIRAPKVTVNKQGYGRIERPHFYIWNREVLTLKEYMIAPNRRSTGQPLPNVSYSRSSGFSGSWYPGFLPSETTAVNGGLHLGQHDKPSEDLLLSESLLPYSVAPGGFVPYSDFAERFGFGYFENIYVPTPDAERGFVGAKRESISEGANFNEFPGARRVDLPFNKEELVFERADTLNNVGLFGQVRGQHIEQIGGPKEDRFLTSASISPPPLVLLPRLYTLVRFDGFGSFGNAKPYGWGHFQAGLVDRMNDMFRIGVAYTRSTEFGTPLFETDQPYKMESINFRGDVLLGPHKVSAIFKYDPTGRRWWDTEFEIAQAVDCLEPYILYRSNPKGFGFGLRLRVDNLMQVMKRRGLIPPGKGPEG